jgi:hypothetical protein
MKTKTKFVDEISGQEFNTTRKALKSEERSKDIKQMFSFWKDYKLDGNDEVGKQRTKAEYDKLILTIMTAIKKYEKWVYGEYKNAKQGDCFIPKYIKGYSMVDRYLDDGGINDIYRWWNTQLTVCQNCYKQYGQPYYALNCKCKKEDTPNGR